MNGSLEFAQARLQARHGARPSDAVWSSLHAAVSLPALLEAARSSAIRPLTAGLESAATPDDVERLLGERLVARIAEVANWMPQKWRPAIEWTSRLLDLDVHTAEAREEWLDAFRASWPPCSSTDRAGMEELVAVIERHVHDFARAPLDEAWPRRLLLQAQLESLFRRHALAPAAAFAHLAIVALDLERLRAEIVAHEKLGLRRGSAS